VNSEQLRIDLGDFRFVKFVECPISHTDEEGYDVRVYFLV